MKKKHNESSCGSLIIEIGRLFINKPYKERTLESLGEEKLIVNVSAFDCMTFVETILSLALCAASGKISRNEFQKNLTLIRYRNGKIDGYFSRLHYFIDWLHDNERKKILINVSKKLGGIPRRKKINFMTTHRELYPAMANKAQFGKISVLESSLSHKVFHVIAKNKLNSLKKRIQNGDVVAFAANQDGLDVAHVGFTLWQGKNLRLLHASSKVGKIVISKNNLVAYLKSNKKFAGIIVARPSF